MKTLPSIRYKLESLNIECGLCPHSCFVLEKFYEFSRSKGRDERGISRIKNQTFKINEN